ncbi:hypothetical protein M422DRAFT_264416 [Sphaerobolus stellatus SS14]|uniref:Uncharacterized protein n=1 Tax=Sphaerobolus stellatus (strain SS14) TaxID=990650 RepID=A0A0C9V875_SPHS4|nr:hypothetical protein M422DRAFT_264416 [Sphaerobolus stellatus SS14]
MPGLIPTRWPLAQRRLSRYKRDHVSRRMGPHEQAFKGQNARVLKELTPNGEASIGVNIAYNAPLRGEMRIAVWAFAMISLPSASSFSIFGRKDKDANVAKKEDKPYEMKKSPSNTILHPAASDGNLHRAHCFCSPNPLEHGVVIESKGKLKKAIVDSVVLPYVVCIPFFDTTHNTTRGAIFGSIPRDVGRDGVVLGNAIIRKGKSRLGRKVNDDGTDAPSNDKPD